MVQPSMEFGTMKKGLNREIERDPLRWIPSQMQCGGCLPNY